MVKGKPEWGICRDFECGSKAYECRCWISNLTLSHVGWVVLYKAKISSMENKKKMDQGRAKSLFGWYCCTFGIPIGIQSIYILYIYIEEKSEGTPIRTSERVYKIKGKKKKDRK